MGLNTFRSPGGVIGHLCNLDERIECSKMFLHIFVKQKILMRSNCHILGDTMAVHPIDYLYRSEEMRRIWDEGNKL